MITTIVVLYVIGFLFSLIYIADVKRPLFYLLLLPIIIPLCYLFLVTIIMIGLCVLVFGQKAKDKPPVINKNTIQLKESFTPTLFKLKFHRH